MWVQVDTNLPRHFKMRKAAARLRVCEPQMIGHLVCLWSYALEMCPEGEISRLGMDGIALAAQWPGEAEPFFQTLVDVGFVEVIDDTWLLHDWKDYSGSLLKVRESTHQRVAAWRERQRAAVQTHSQAQATPQGPLQATPVSVVSLPSSSAISTTSQKNEERAASTTPADPAPTLFAEAAPPAEAAPSGGRRAKREFRHQIEDAYWIAAQEGMGYLPGRERELREWDRILLDLKKRGYLPEKVKLFCWHYRNRCPDLALTLYAATKSWVINDVIVNGVVPADPATVQKQPTQPQGERNDRREQREQQQQLARRAGDYTAEHRARTLEAARRLQQRLAESGQPEAKRNVS
jgi:hypothetical protein